MGPDRLSFMSGLSIGKIDFSAVIVVVTGWSTNFCRNHKHASKVAHIYHHLPAFYGLSYILIDITLFDIDFVVHSHCFSCFMSIHFFIRNLFVICWKHNFSNIPAWWEKIKILVISTRDSCITRNSFEYIKMFLLYKIMFFIFRRPPPAFVRVSKA